MTDTKSLIQKLYAAKQEYRGESSVSLFNAGLEKAIAIVRQHEAEMEGVLGALAVEAEHAKDQTTVNKVEHLKAACSEISVVHLSGDEALINAMCNTYLDSLPEEEEGTAYKAGMAAILAFLRQQKPVIVSLKDCVTAIAQIFVPDGIYNIEEGWEMERAAKAVLDAAGVAYGD